jgi:hypothetical protein
MTPSNRSARLLGLRRRRREQAAADVAARGAHVATIDRAVAATRGAEAASRTFANVDAATLVVAWAHADGLARRAMGLLDERVHALTAAEGAREALRDRWSEEQQLVRLAARRDARVEARTAHARDRRLAELVLRSHGRRR